MQFFWTRRVMQRHTHVHFNHSQLSTDQSQFASGTHHIHIFWIDPKVPSTKLKSNRWRRRGLFAKFNELLLHLKALAYQEGCMSCPRRRQWRYPGWSLSRSSDGLPHRILQLTCVSTGEADCRRRGCAAVYDIDLSTTHLRYRYIFSAQFLR